MNLQINEHKGDMVALTGIETVSTHPAPSRQRRPLIVRRPEVREFV